MTTATQADLAITNRSPRLEQPRWRMSRSSRNLPLTAVLWQQKKGLSSPFAVRFFRFSDLAAHIDHRRSPLSYQQHLGELFL
jgi:hypothetical protein